MADQPRIESDLDRWDRTNNVLAEIMEECEQQFEKWGQQDHPVTSAEDPTGIYLLGRTFRSFEIFAKQRFANGERSWALIELEEIFEALSERDPAKCRAEWIQVAAVAVTAIMSMDRGAGLPPEGPPITDDVPSRYTDLVLPGEEVIPWSRLRPDTPDTATMDLRPTVDEVRAAECVINSPAAPDDVVSQAEAVLQAAEESGVRPTGTTITPEGPQYTDYDTGDDLS